jgi:hypothetical protein
MTPLPRHLAACALALAAPALAAEQGGAQGDPMAGWKPRKVASEAADKKQIMALFQAMEDAGQKGDLDAAAALVDFPVLMVTDDSKGQASAEAWSREQWMQVMAPFYKNPMPDMKVTHRPSIFLVTDSLASVDDLQTMTLGARKLATRTSSLVVRKDGKWLVKSMVEGGWGDAMKQGGGAASEGGAQAGGGAGSAPSAGQGQGGAK